jgi:hypothetical protein
MFLGGLYVRRAFGPASQTLAMPQLAISSPKYFPWAVDRAANLARRKVPELGEPLELPIDLTPLHLALDSYMLQPNPQRLALARHHLAVVQAATADIHMPWWEIHEFATILLDAEEWHPLPDA